MNATNRIPDFVVAGYSRSGTTWLHSILIHHPDIFLSNRKELHYFDRNRALGLGFYDRYLGSASQAQIAGDVTPTYVEMVEIGEVISSELPAARIVVILRDPRDRLPSVHSQLVRDGRHRGDIAALLIANGKPSHFLERQLYAPCLRSLYAHYAAERVGVFVYDDLVADSEAFVRQVLRFLDLDADKFPRPMSDALDVRQNPTVVPRSARLHRRLQGVNKRLRLTHNPGADRVANFARDFYRSHLVSSIRNVALSVEASGMITELCRDDVEHVSDLLNVDLVARWWTQ